MNVNYKHQLILPLGNRIKCNKNYKIFFCSFSGPEKWPELFPMASGHRQSPVNIDTKITTRSSTLKAKPLSWKYVPENTRSLVNPGYCWRVDVNGEGSELTGGPLTNDKYMLEQFHCHWGCSDGKGNVLDVMEYVRTIINGILISIYLGSEHTVDGLSYSGELHLGNYFKNNNLKFRETNFFFL